MTCASPALLPRDPRGTFGASMSGVDEFGGILEGVLTDADGVARYTLRGDVDQSNADRLLGRLIGVLEDGRPFLELDLADVSFMDSSGVRALILVNRAAQERGGAFLILRPSPPVVRIVQLAGVQDALPMMGGVSWEDLAG